MKKLLLIFLYVCVCLSAHTQQIVPAPSSTVIVDTAWAMVKAKPDQTLRVYPTDAYGVPLNFNTVDIQVVDSGRHGIIVTHTSSFTYTPEAEYEGLDMVLCKLINQQGEEVLVNVEMLFTNQLSYEGSDFYFTLLQLWQQTITIIDIRNREADPTIYAGFRVLAHYDTRVWITDENGNKSTIDLQGGRCYEFLGHHQGNRAIQIHSSAPIAIEAFNYREFNQEVSAILPNTLLGERYVIQTPRSIVNDWPHVFAVVATRNNTIVDIHLTSESRQHAEGDTYSIVLDAGQMHVVESNTYMNHRVDAFSGSSVISSAPVAVFQGAYGTQLFAPGTVSMGAIDHLYEQALPTKFAGKEYVVVGTPAFAYDYAELVALEDGTTIQTNDSAFTLNAYEVSTIIMGKDAVQHIVASKPILCNYFLCGGQYEDSNLGDPAQTIIVPLEQATQLSDFTCHRIASTPAAIGAPNNRQGYINVVCPTSALDSMFLDGQPMTGFLPVPNSNDTLSYVMYPMMNESGIHTLSNTQAGFIAYEYGLQQTEAYAFNLPTMFHPTASELEIVYDTTCSTHPYYFRGEWLNQTGTYFDTIKRGDIQFITQLELFVQQVKTMEVRYDTVCPENPVVLGKYVHDSTGVYYDIVENGYCDDTVEIHLQVPYHFDRHIYDTICSNEMYYHRAKSWKKPGIYLDTIKSSIGCDSVYEFIHLENWPIYETSEYDTICIDESFLWNGKSYTLSGTYTDTLQSIHGCDSVAHLELFSFPCYDQMPIQEPDPLNWSDPFAMPNMDTASTEPFNWQDPFIVHPIDSIDEPQDPMNWKDPFLTDIVYDTIACHTSYMWRGHTYTKTGLYRDTLYSINGCDSIVYLNLYVEQCCDTTYSLTDTIIPYAQPFEWFGQSYTEPGYYCDTTINATNCDSIGELYLHYHYSDTMPACGEESVTFITPFGSWHSGECDTLNGCLQMTEDGLCLVEGALYVQRLQPDLVSEDTTICAGMPVQWHGLTLLDEGSYYDTIHYTSEGACDSLYCRMTIHHNTSITTDTTDYICFGADYTWHGQELTDITEDRTLVDVLSTADGCDSVVTLTLHILPQPTTRMEQQAICEGTSYTWHTYRDSVVTLPGLYEDTLWTEQGCVQETYTLMLSHKTCECDTAYSTTYKQIKEEELPLFQWNGISVPQVPQAETRDTTLVFPTIKADASCDSIATLHLHILAPCEFPTKEYPKYWRKED